MVKIFVGYFLSFLMRKIWKLFLLKPSERRQALFQKWGSASRKTNFELQSMNPKVPVPHFGNPILIASGHRSSRFLSKRAFGVNGQAVSRLKMLKSRNLISNRDISGSSWRTPIFFWDYSGGKLFDYCGKVS